MGRSHVADEVVKVSNASKEFRIVQIKEAFPVEVQPCYMGMLILEPTPFIQLVPTGLESTFCEQYVQQLQYRGESDAQIARFRRHTREMTQVVYWCSDTLLVPEELCKPIGRVITAKWIEGHGIRLMEGITKSAMGL